MIAMVKVVEALMVTDGGHGNNHKGNVDNVENDADDDDVETNDMDNYDSNDDDITTMLSMNLAAMMITGALTPLPMLLTVMIIDDDGDADNVIYRLQVFIY